MEVVVCHVVFFFFNIPVVKVNMDFFVIWVLLILINVYADQISEARCLITVVAPCNKCSIFSEINLNIVHVTMMIGDSTDMPLL